jgi:Protein of unknown function (DUF2510)
MSHVMSSGWYGDPSRTHEHRYWDGTRWTSAVSDRGSLSEHEVAAGRFGPPGSGDRLAIWALGVLLVGGAVALAATVVWGEWMGISSTLAEEDRVRGWAAVLRTVPAALLAWAVPVVAMLLAVRTCRRGSAALGRAVIWLSGGVLFVVSVSIIGGTVESALTGSHPELKWALLPASIAIAAGSTYLALRAARRQPA